jgi:hypothetical protein
MAGAAAEAGTTEKAAEGLNFAMLSITEPRWYPRGMLPCAGGAAASGICPLKNGRYSDSI